MDSDDDSSVLVRAKLTAARRIFGGDPIDETPGGVKGQH
jgi:hypothetical protein